MQDSVTDIGVEVTTAVPSADKEKDHLFSLLTHNLGTDKQRAKSKDQIRKLGGIYNDIGVMTSWDQNGNDSHLMQTLIERLSANSQQIRLT